MAFPPHKLRYILKNEILSFKTIQVAYLMILSNYVGLILGVSYYYYYYHYYYYKLIIFLCEDEFMLFCLKTRQGVVLRIWSLQNEQPRKIFKKFKCIYLIHEKQNKPFVLHCENKQMFFILKKIN